MFESISNSWQLVKASWAVLKADKELIWFPIISGATMLLMTIFFLLPIGAILGIFGVMSDSNTVSEVLAFVLMFLFYLVSNTVVLYFNTALMGAAMIRLDGGDPTLKDGFRIANERLGKIAMYATINATVGVILQTLRERGGIIGSIVSSIGAFAWGVMTFFVIPILIVKDISPIDAIKESTALLRKTWGEQLVGGFGVGTVTGLMTLGVILLGMLLGFLAIGVLDSGLLLGVVVLLTILAVVAIGIVSSALSSVYRVVVFRFAEYGSAPDDFDIDMIRGAFKEKRKNG